MGACSGKVEHKTIMRKSILGSLIPDNEWESFYTFCKLETYAISKHVHVHKNDLFYVVISGVVTATIQNTSKTNQNEHPVVVRTYRQGEVIHMFKNTIRTHDGHLLYKDLKLTFCTHSMDGNVTLVSVDEESITKFLDKPRNNENNNIDSFKWFCNLQASELLKDNKWTHGLSKEQLDVLGPLMELALFEEGEIVQYTSALNMLPTSLVEPVTTPSRKKKQAKTRTCPGVFLGGSCISLNQDISFEEFRTKFGIRDSLSAAESSSKSFKQRPIIKVQRSQSIIKSFKKTFLPHKQAQIHSISGVNYEESGEIYKPGMLYGLEYYFFNKDRGFQNIVTTADSVIGFLSNDILDGIKHADHKFYKRLYSNFNLFLLHSIESTVPLVADLSFTDKTHLSTKLTHRVCEPNEIIYHQGDPGENLFIIVYGIVQETISVEANQATDGNGLHIDHENSNPITAPPTGAIRRRSSFAGYSNMTLFRGQFFGEVAIVTDSPYQATMTAREQTYLLVISKATFRSIFDHDKSKLAEMKIRLLGEDVDLEFLLCHPKGYVLFLDFLEKEHASENIQFWNAVDRFDDMYRRLWKQYLQAEAENAQAHVSRSRSIASNFSEEDGSLRDSSLSTVRQAGSRENGIASSMAAVRSLEMNLKELHDVCKNIIDKFIVDGAPSQVNIPGKMRIETENMYKEWVFGDNDPDDLTVPTGSKKEHSSSRVDSVFDSTSFVKVKDIFKRPKKEVYELLKKDTYVRLKLTQEFHDFIASVKPVKQNSFNQSLTMSPNPNYHGSVNSLKE